MLTLTETQSDVQYVTQPLRVTRYAQETKVNNIDREALAEAASALVEDADAVQLFQQLVGVYELAKKGVPVRLVGRAAVLNALLALWLEDEDAAMRVLDLVNNKRHVRGLSPVGDQDYQRRAYMREFMAAKRERGRRLVTLINQLRVEDDKLRGTARAEFERLHANRWFGVRKEREEALRRAKGAPLEPRGTQRAHPTVLGGR